MIEHFLSVITRLLTMMPSSLSVTLSVAKALASAAVAEVRAHNALLDAHMRL